MSPLWGRGGAFQASPAAVQIPAGDTWPWSTARAASSGSGGSRCHHPSPAPLSFLHTQPAFLKQSPPAFKSGWSQGSFQICFIAKPSERSGRKMLPLLSSFLAHSAAVARAVAPQPVSSAPVIPSLLAHREGQCRATDTGWVTDQRADLQVRGTGSLHQVQAKPWDLGSSVSRWEKSGCPSYKARTLNAPRRSSLAVLDFAASKHIRLWNRH